MKRKEVLVILTLIIVAILTIGMVFTIAIYEGDDINFDKDFEYKESVIGTEIINPDRIVYRNEFGKYFEFKMGEENYNKIKALLGNSITTYNKKGERLKDEQIDEIHSKSFIEFDYKKASKNYIIQLEENDSQAVIKLADSGGMIVAEKIENLNKIKKTLKIYEEKEVAHSLEYKELISRNVLNDFEGKENLIEVKYGIYQVKISNYEEYKKFVDICSIAIEEKITEETFKNNDIILTVSLLPKVDVKVNLGNIKYNYSRIENANYQYNVHLLIVDRIVNTDCIYNFDSTDVEGRVDYDNMNLKYNNSVENIDENVFVNDFDEFINEYNNSKSNISKADAEKIAEIGFKEAERICGAYSPNTQKCREDVVVANNFFTRKTDERDEIFEGKIEAYVFTRVDDMDLNGVQIFVDKRLGKIIGGGAFGD